MLLGLCVLVIFARGVEAQASEPRAFCADPPPVYRGNHFEIIVNQTTYEYGRNIKVTVRPKTGGKFKRISDMFLYVPATTRFPGKNGTHFVGTWDIPPAWTENCGKTNLVAGVKSAYPRWPTQKFTATWVAPMPEYYFNTYYQQYFTPPGDIERQRPHVYIAVYVTPDPPPTIWAPGTNGRGQRRWYFAHSVKVENKEKKEERERQLAWERYQRQMLDLYESMN